MFPPPPAPDKSSVSTNGNKSPPLLSNPDDVGFQVVTAGHQAATRANEFPTAAEPSPPTLGTRFDALVDQDEHTPCACIEATVPAAYSAQALFKAVRLSQPEVATLFSQQQSDFNSMVNLIRADMENSRTEILVAITDSIQQNLGNLRCNVVDQGTSITDLGSNIRKQESLLKGYRDKTDKIAATLHSDVNDARARIPLLCRELQDSAARMDALLCQEIRDSATDLVTSIKEIEVIIQDLRAQVAIPPSGNPGPATPATPRLRGVSVDPPPTPTPVATRFQLHGGVLNPYWGSDSFPPGNRPPRDTALVTMHDTNQDRGRVATDHASGTSCMSPMRRDPLAGDLRKNPTQTTPARPGSHEDGTRDRIVGGPIKSP
jgi:hypothetical protein